MLKRDRTKGFTLVELLLVISILGIIVAIAIPTLAGQRRRARMIGDATTNTKVIMMTLEARRAELGVYGAPAKYNYTTSPVGRPTDDIIPSFRPEGNSKMNFEIEIKSGGLTYEVTVTEPGASDWLLKGNETGKTGDKKTW